MPKITPDQLKDIKIIDQVDDVMIDFLIKELEAIENLPDTSHSHEMSAIMGQTFDNRVKEEATKTLFDMRHEDVCRVAAELLMNHHLRPAMKSIPMIIIASKITDTNPADLMRKAISESREKRAQDREGME